VTIISSSSVPPLSSDCPHILQAPKPHKTTTVDSLTSGTTRRHSVQSGAILVSVHHTTPMNFHLFTRIAVRSTLIQQGPQTCSDIVRGMGLDPRRHKGTIHAVMVDLEREGILSATMKGKRRDLWFIHTDKIRKRDRIAAALLG
jgi:hypothetical protein